MTARRKSTRPKLTESLPFSLEHFQRWTSELVLDTGRKWELEEFQAAFARDVFSGVPECWLVIPEGNAKTTLCAALALYHCQFTESASVPVAAASRDQAEILFRQAEGFVDRSKSITDLFICQEGYRRIRCDSTHSRIQVFAADDKTGDGVIPTFAIVDEPHRQKDLSLYRTWRGKIEKRHGQIVAISTSGEPGTEFELTREQIRQRADITDRTETFLRAASDSLVLHEWAVPEDGDVEDLALVKQANPLKAITIPMLQRKWDSPTMTLAHWRRFVCNLPTRALTAAIQETEWLAAKTGDPIPPGVPIWLGLDVAWVIDTTAMVPLWIRDVHYRQLGPATILIPPRDGTMLDGNLVQHALLEIHARNPIHTVVMDVSKAEFVGQWIQQQLGAVVVNRTQNNPFAVLDYERFMEALRNDWLKHAGDQGLSSHVFNAVARMLPDGRIRFDRPNQSRTAIGEQSRRVIDALTAAAMVHSTATEVPEVINTGFFAIA